MSSTATAIVEYKGKQKEFVVKDETINASGLMAVGLRSYDPGISSSHLDPCLVEWKGPDIICFHFSQGT